MRFMSHMNGDDEDHVQDSQCLGHNNNNDMCVRMLIVRVLFLAGAISTSGTETPPIKTNNR